MAESVSGKVEPLKLPILQLANLSSRVKRGFTRLSLMDSCEIT